MMWPTMAVIATSFIAATAVLAKVVTQHPLLVVVSLDSLHADDVRPDTMPTLSRFRDEHAAPPYMRPAFPTKTFVNHHTIATGLHPEQHGVLDNYMFDRDHRTMYKTYEQFHYDEAVVPIWIQNENDGDGRYSGVMMWPGSWFPYQGKKTNICRR
ncbi:bis(5'-adenosyl)-triphosphatase enpp4-like [Sipha flava]|uniref:Bis(5'-adenosyl)-triphosphatase enpp4-like n=1 Tax=Sipha flava TaxID=143950 RepID=A0A8B8FBQ2_9HEMI|nr:bis(5'-adenosyl)-triphosphatase enpp4-like [Sipha flava]XP_025407746.1 bis(5'-adenosyl)-triphosphatase enpp4-like [Sipha flava]